MIYPGHAHGLMGREARLHLHRMIVRFFSSHLDVPIDPSTF